MKIAKNFLFLICITPLLQSIAMEESTPQEIQKTLRLSLAALSLEMPQYPMSDARKNFDNLINTFCLTKDNQGYDFLNELQREQDNLAKEKYSLKMDNIDYLAKSNVLKQKQEGLKQQEDNVNKCIEQAKVELGKLEALQKKFESNQVSREKQYKKECAEFQKKIIEDNQKSLTTITNKQKAEFEVNYENLKTQLETEYQGRKKTLETKYENSINTLESQKATLEKEIASLKNESEIKLTKYILKTGDEPARNNEITQKQFRQNYTHLFLGLTFGSLVTGFGMRYLDIVPIVAKLFNKTH